MMNELLDHLMVWLQGNPWLGLLLTMGVFYGTQWVYHRFNSMPLLHPVLLSILVIIMLLLFFDVNYEQYIQGGQVVHFLLGPATVALAWPLYQNFKSIKKIWLPVLLAVTSGVLVGATSAIYLAQWFGADVLTQLSLAPKSVTTPVAIAVVEKIGGLPALTAGFVIITGVIGAMFGATVFKWMGIHNEQIKGIAMGVSAHGVGTARAWQLNPVMGAHSGLAMTVSALLIAFILPPWLALLGLI